MKTKLGFFGFLLLIGFSAFAQKKFSEGTINYDIVINTGSTKPQAADFFDGATSTVYIKGNKSRTEMVSSLGTQSTIIDESKNSIVVLKEYGDQKYMIQMTPEDWKEANKKYEGVTFTYFNDTKEILGYTCKKAIGRLSEGTNFTVWYTPDLIPENKDFQSGNQSLPGLAMQYEASMSNLTIMYSVSKISLAPVPVAKFDLPKSGFRLMTYAESKGNK
jgi:GLPGLI family protein